MVNIQLDESVAAALAALASAQGQSLGEYLRSLVTSAHAVDETLTSAEVVARIEAASVATHSLYEGDYPREIIYSDHD